MAEAMLVEVLGRIRPDNHDIVLPALTDLPGSSQPTRLWSIVEQYAADDAGVPGVLQGEEADGIDRATVDHDFDSDPQAIIARLATAASAAAAAATDGDTSVRARYGVVPTRHYLLRLTVNRSLIAHYVAAYLGSTACPLPEELARPLWELTQPDADVWRALGIFGAPMAVPHLASWRDTFLLSAGHLPHPLGHLE